MAPGCISVALRLGLLLLGPFLYLKLLATALTQLHAIALVMAILMRSAITKVGWPSVSIW